MSQVTPMPLREFAETVRRLIADWDGFVSRMDAVVRENEERGVRLDQLTRECAELRQAREQLLETHTATVAELTELRGTHQTLGEEHRGALETLHQLRRQYEEALEDRLHAAEQLEGVLRRLKP